MVSLYNITYRERVKRLATAKCGPCVSCRVAAVTSEIADMNGLSSVALTDQMHNAKGMHNGKLFTSLIDVNACNRSSKLSPPRT